MLPLCGFIPGSPKKHGCVCVCIPARSNQYAAEQGGGKLALAAASWHLALAALLSSNLPQLLVQLQQHGTPHRARMSGVHNAGIGAGSNGPRAVCTGRDQQQRRLLYVR